MSYALMSGVIGTPAIVLGVEAGTQDGLVAANHDLSGHDGNGDGGQALVTSSDTWNSGTWENISLLVNAGGGYNGLQGAVGSTGVNYSGLSYGNIVDVQIGAAANTAGVQVSWRSVLVKFYQWGMLLETISVPNGSAPVASASGNATQALHVTPSSSAYTKVYITAQVQFSATDPSAYLDTTAMQGQVLVGVASPTVVSPNVILVPALLQVDTTNLDLSDIGGSPSESGTDPLIIYHITGTAQYQVLSAVVQGLNADVLVQWDTNYAEWYMTIYIEGDVTWTGYGSINPNNPLGDYTTVAWSDTGYGYNTMSLV